jgi:hypothetical protein
MSKSEKGVRQQLLEARANVQRQIDTLQAGPLVNPRGGGLPFEPAIAELMATLKEIDDSLAGLGKDET